MAATATRVSLLPENVTSRDSSIAAGRSEHKVKAIAEQYRFEYRAFDLNKPKYIDGSPEITSS